MNQYIRGRENSLYVIRSIGHEVKRLHPREVCDSEVGSLVKV